MIKVYKKFEKAINLLRDFVITDFKINVLFSDEVMKIMEERGCFDEAWDDPVDDYEAEEQLDNIYWAILKNKFITEIMTLKSYSYAYGFKCSEVSWRDNFFILKEDTDKVKKVLEENNIKYKEV